MRDFSYLDKCRKHLKGSQILLFNTSLTNPLALNLGVENGTSWIAAISSSGDKGTGFEIEEQGGYRRWLAQESLELPPQIAFRAGLMNLPELDRRGFLYRFVSPDWFEDTANLTNGLSKSIPRTDILFIIRERRGRKKRLEQSACLP